MAMVERGGGRPWVSDAGVTTCISTDSGSSRAFLPAAPAEEGICVVSCSEEVSKDGGGAGAELSLAPELRPCCCCCGVDFGCESSRP